MEISKKKKKKKNLIRVTKLQDKNGITEITKKKEILTIMVRKINKKGNKIKKKLNAAIIKSLYSYSLILISKERVQLVHHFVV